MSDLTEWNRDAGPKWKWWPWGNEKTVGVIAHRRGSVGARSPVAQQTQQHTGVPPIVMQQEQPAFMQAVMQSQQPWIMSQQALSPLVQVTQQPSLVISTLHAPIVRLQQQTVIPFIMQQRLHMPPAIIVHRFCIMVQAVGSSHTQVIFIPPAHFSIFIVQRGTITMFGIEAGIPPVIGMFDPIPGIPIVGRSIIIAVVMIRSSGLVGERRFRGPPRAVETVFGKELAPENWHKFRESC